MPPKVLCPTFLRALHFLDSPWFHQNTFSIFSFPGLFRIIGPGIQRQSPLRIIFYNVIRNRENVIFGIYRSRISLSSDFVLDSGFYTTACHYPMPNVSDRAHAGKLQSVIPCGVLSGFPPTTDLQSGAAPLGRSVLPCVLSYLYFLRVFRSDKASVFRLFRAYASALINNSSG